MTERAKLIYTLKQIETPRLIIRPVQLGDEVEINKGIHNSLEILQKWQAWAKDPSFETTLEFVQRGVFSWDSGRAVGFPMVVVHKQDKKIIAASGYTDKSNPNEGIYEIGYWCDKDYQGQGFVTEYTNALTRYAFDVLFASKVVISMLVENEKSRAVAIRLNFTSEGIKDHDPSDCVPGRVAKDYVYSTNNTNKLPYIQYSHSSNENNPTVFESISWAKDNLNISSQKAFAMSRAIAKTPWSYVYEINTGNELVYLKITPEMFSKEPEIIQFLDKHSNASLPHILATNSDLNCFLMKNAGHTLRTVLKQNFREDLLFRTIDQFTNLQIDIAEHVNILLEMGVPDYRLENIPSLYVQLIKQKELLLTEGLTEDEVKQLEMLSSTVCELCDRLASYHVKQTVVQPDFNDNNTLFDEVTERITIIDLGEIVISHPFLSLINFLKKIETQYGLTEECDLYYKLHEACFKGYNCYFTSSEDFKRAFKIAEVVNLIAGTVYQVRFMNACGIDNLKVFNHWKLGDLLKTFLAISIKDI